MGEIADLINKFGFPIIAAVGMGYLIKYVYSWATTEVKPVISQANGTLIGLIDRVRLLENDLIRLNQKVETVLALRGKSIERERVKADEKINQVSEDIPIGKRPATKEEIKAAAGDD